MIFRSRIRTLLRFMNTLYLDKRDRVRSWFTLPRIVASAAALLLFLFAPVWHQTVTARFLLEPVRQAVVRTMVPGRVTDVMVAEGQPVRAGDLLLRMANANLESERAGSRERYALTGAQGVQAQLAHGDLGPALEEHRRAGVDEAITANKFSELMPRAPIDGVVTTPRLRDLVGSYLDAGAIVTGVADTREMRARILPLQLVLGAQHSASARRFAARS
jgi:putative peptide zinc metalloprotease protein